MSKPKLLCIMGETSSGKDSVLKAAINRMSKYELNTICSYTDRNIRDNETDGVEHYFVSTDEFNNLKSTRAKDILAYSHIKKDNGEGYQYMALTDELDRSHFYVIDPNGVKDLLKNHKNKVDIIQIYIFAPIDQRIERAKSSRSDFDTEFKNRVDAETCQFHKFRVNHEYDYMIDNCNGNFENAVNKLCSIIEHELLNSHAINTPKLKPQKTNN